MHPPANTILKSRMGENRDILIMLAYRTSPQLAKHYYMNSVLQGGPERTQTPTINNLMKTRGEMKRVVCSNAYIEFFSQQNDTKIINFDEGVLILWPFFWGNVIFKICHFCLKSHNWRTKNVQRLAPPGKVPALVLKKKKRRQHE